MSFYTWIQQFTNDDSAVGDLARDCKNDNRHYGSLYDDSGFPRYSNDEKKIREYFTISRNASDDCIKVFDSVFPLYQEYLGNLEELDKQ